MNFFIEYYFFTVFTAIVVIDTRTKLIQKIEKDYFHNKFTPELSLKLNVEVFKKLFSKSEIEEMIDEWKSPSGKGFEKFRQRMIEKAPKLLEEKSREMAWELDLKRNAVIKRFLDENGINPKQPNSKIEPVAGGDRPR